MSILKQSTAVTIKLGPFVDDTDGKTAETGLTISQADIRLSKNGGDFAQTNNSAGATADEFGYYDVPLDTTDTNTLGRLRVAVLESGALPVWQDFVVVTANVYDTLFSTDKLDVNVVEMAADVLTASALKADAVTEIQSGLATTTHVQEVEDKVDTVDTNVDAILEDTGTTIPATLTTIDGHVSDTFDDVGDVKTELDTVLADTNEIQAELADGGRTDLLIDAIKAKTDNLPADPADDSDIDTAIAAVKSVVDAVKLKTDNLPADPADDSDIDAQLAAIKAKTDNLPADPADESLLEAAISAVSIPVEYTAARALKLDYLDAAISSRASGGEGSISWEYTVTDEDSQPITFCSVWVSSDAAGTAIEATGITNASGVVTFLLNAGTYYVWRKKRGYRFTNPDVEVVS